MIDPDDLAHCAAAIRHGSRSFHAAARLLPPGLRAPSLALYAFCRIADDAVDLGADKHAAVAGLRARLDRAYAGRPRDLPAERAFAAVIEGWEMPRALPEALLEGLEWDAEGRRPADLSEVRAYSARVAAAVGAMMCVLMRVRDADVLARACDLGVAMQLTNIARDVGEDAVEGRLYLPRDWLDEAGVAEEAFLADPGAVRELPAMVHRLLCEADALYERAEAGIAALPPACRPGIFAARHIYAGIGARLRRNRFDPLSERARTTGVQKTGWLALAATRSCGTLVLPRSPLIHARPLPETAFLVEAAARRTGAGHWADVIHDTLAGLKQRDREAQAALLQEARRPRTLA